MSGHRSHRSRKSRGQTTIIVALCAAVLFSSVALGVDGARFYAEGLRVQRAADEAALVAVSQSSNGGDVAATLSAADEVTHSLPLAPGASVSVSTTLTVSPTNAVTVNVTERNFPLFFAPVLGLTSATVSRQAVAQYEAPVPMGNPSNTLGDPGDPNNPNDPNHAMITVYKPNPNGTPYATAEPQNMSLSVNGPDQATESGDPYSPLYVLSDPPVANVSGAQLIQNPFRANASPPFNGYDYEVTIPPNTTGDTFIQVYDASTCTSGSNFGDLMTSGTYGVPFTTQPQVYPASGYGGASYVTYYGLTWLDPATGQREPITSSGANLVPVTGYTGDTGYMYPGQGATSLPANTIIAATEGDGSNKSCDATLSGKWKTLAVVANTTAGASYIINVNTCAGMTPNEIPTDETLREASSASGNNLPNCIGSEINNFVLRAVTTTDPAGACADGTTYPDCQSLTPNDPNNQPQVAGVGRESIMVRAPGDALIYLAKIAPIYAGKWLMVKLFDPGDMSGGSSMQIVRPDGSYAPFEWYTQTLDGSGQPFQTALQSNESTSLITSYPWWGNGPSPTPIPTNTPANTPTSTSTNTPTATNTPRPTHTPTPTYTPTSTVTPGPSPTSTATRTPTATHTPRPTNTPTSTVTPGPSPTPTQTSTPRPTNTPTLSPTATFTPLPTNTPTSTPTNTPTDTPTPTPTPLPTATPTPAGPAGFQPDPAQVPAGANTQSRGLYVIDGSFVALTAPSPTATATASSTPFGAIYTAPTAYPSPTWCPSGDVAGNLSPSGSQAIGQTMAEDNPFDPLHQGTCFSAPDYQNYDAQPMGNLPTPVAWITPATSSSVAPTPGPLQNSDFEEYNLYPNIGGRGYNYRPFNGRWVYMFTKIPDDYATNGNGPGNPNQWWWYVQYHITGNTSFTDRTTWEVMVIDTPPHLIQ